MISDGDYQCEFCGRPDSDCICPLPTPATDDEIAESWNAVFEREGVEFRKVERERDAALKLAEDERAWALKRDQDYANAMAQIAELERELDPFHAIRTKYSRELATNEERIAALEQLYLSAVSGRKAFREAFRKARKERDATRAEAETLRAALDRCRKVFVAFGADEIVQDIDAVREGK